VHATVTNIDSRSRKVEMSEDLLIILFQSIVAGKNCRRARHLPMGEASADGQT
jgi:hypothetical protein